MSTTTNGPQRDNLLGICHHIGEAVGINPLYLRVLLAAGLLFDPKLSLLVYAAFGAIVLGDKLVARLTRRRTAKARILQYA